MYLQNMFRLCDSGSLDRTKLMLQMVEAAKTRDRGRPRKTNVGSCWEDAKVRGQWRM